MDSIGQALGVEGFRLATVAKVAGLSVHMLNYLCRWKIVVPSAEGKRGRGVKRRYSYSDVLLLRVIGKLLRQGISPLRLRKSFAALQARGRQSDELVSKRFVITDGRSIYFEDNGSLEMLSSGQLAFAFVLELTLIREEVRQKIAGRAKAA